MPFDPITGEWYSETEGGPDEVGEGLGFEYQDLELDWQNIVKDFFPEGGWDEDMGIESEQDWYDKYGMHFWDYDPLKEDIRGRKRDTEIIKWQHKLLKDKKNLDFKAGSGGFVTSGQDRDFQESLDTLGSLEFLEGELSFKEDVRGFQEDWQDEIYEQINRVDDGSCVESVDQCPGNNEGQCVGGECYDSTDCPGLQICSMPACVCVDVQGDNGGGSCPDCQTMMLVGNTWMCQNDGSCGWGDCESQYAFDYCIDDCCNTGGGDDGGSCFHPDTTVEYEDGSIRTVREVKYGDKVKAVDKNGNIIYSEVWEDKYFNYKDTTRPKYYVTIKAGNKTLKVTTQHTVFVDNLKKNVNAKNVKPGMYVNVVDYEKDIVERRMVDSVTHDMDYGLYDLYTKEGTVIADGIVTGTLAFFKHKPAQFFHKFFNKHPKLYALAYKYIYNPWFHYFYPIEEEKSLDKNRSEVRI